MSSTSGGGGGSDHIYGFPNGPSQDRHIQNIIEHAHELFPEHSFEHPRFASTDVAETPGHGHYLNPVGEDDQQLDDFDRQLLGRPSASLYAPSTATTSPRLSLPHSNVAALRQRRILGDASHHFRPFVPRGNHPQPYFANPINLNHLNPSPATRPIFDRDGSHRVMELQPGRQLVTPPFYTAEQRRGSPLPSVQSSSSELGGSSPSTRLSLRREESQVVRPPPPSQLASNSVKLNLNHAPLDLTPKVNGTRLVNPRKALSDKCRAVFPYELFNSVQSKCFPLVYGSNDNVVISAPTGSGKTAILEMAICKLATSPGGERFKIVYQAPTKSLCSERARDWSKKFSHLNLRCVELTGDTSLAQTQRVGSASIIVTTPEKWDSITRKWSDHRRLLEMIRLVLIDEVHILKDVRGATLEAVVSRMKISGANVRFVALSATVPNIADIAAWLGRDHANQTEPAKWASFGEEFRPVKLKKYVYGYDHPGNDFLFDKSLNGKLNLLLTQHKSGKPIMVFCFTRKICEQTARNLAEWWSALTPDDKPWPAPTQSIPVVNKDLQELVKYGIAFHHAGLDVQDKSSVERHFLNGQLHVICCTSTLAVGVNLPCHTVVLKGTISWTDDGPQEYSDLEVMQMLGRAGRPQFDKNAVAIIMTKRGNASRYERMISGEEVLESKLHLNLIEHLNSEIGLGTIQTLVNAKKWISSTFLNVRMRQAPELYQSEIQHAGAALRAGQSPDDRIQAWCERDIKLLQQYRLITCEDRFSATEYGNAMSRYMIKFETMKLLLSIPSAADLEELLSSLSKAAEFNDLRFKSLEKAFLRDLNQSVLHPVKESINEDWHKIYLLVQMHLGRLEVPSNKDTGVFIRQMLFDKKLLFDRLNRLVRCFIDCKVSDCDSVGARVALELTRAIAAESWEGHSTQLQQIQGLGPVAVRKLVSHNIHTVLDLANRDFEDIERIMSRNSPFGKTLLKSLDGFPRLTIIANIVNPPGTYATTGDTVSVIVKVRLGYSNAKLPFWNSKTPVVTLLVDTTDGRLAYFWRSNIKHIDGANGTQIQFPVVLSGANDKISCHYSCEEIVGTQVMEMLTPNIPVSAFHGTKKRHEPVVQPDADHPSFQFDEFGDLEDADMLAIDLPGDATADSEQPDIVRQSEELDAEFLDIDDVLHGQDDEVPSAPVQMENGKWMCNHCCRGGGLTKSGKPCSHKCCHEGMDKPRPPPRKKTTEATIDNNLAMETQSTRPQKLTRHSNDTVAPNPSRQRQARTSDSKSSNSTSAREMTHPHESRRRAMSVSQPGSSNATKNHLKRSSGPPKASDGARTSKKMRPSLHDDDMDEIECIDLCTATDDDETDKTATTSRNKSKVAAKKDKNKLGDLHRRVLRQDITPARLTNPYKSTTAAWSQSGLSAEERDDNPDGSHYGSDEDDFPEIGDLVRLAEETQEAASSQSQMEPNLSFTTVSELEKASQRYDLESQKEQSSHDVQRSSSSASTKPEQSELGNTGWFRAREDRSFIENGGAQLEDGDDANGPLFFDTDPFQVAVDVDENAQEEPIEPTGEPAWLSEIDPEIVSMVRGYVEFID